MPDGLSYLLVYMNLKPCIKPNLISQKTLFNKSKEIVIKKKSKEISFYEKLYFY
jgi:hypothetical protein